jgi:cation-transporting P-type ATPase 13A2
VVALLLSCYMLLDPAQWLADFMQLTTMSMDFRIFILALGIGYFILSWSGEKYIFPKVAKLLGSLKEKLGKPKRRKSYKVVQDKMLI